MKKALSSVLGILVIFLFCGIAMAESGSWINGSINGGAEVWGVGEAYTSGHSSGEAASWSWTGGTNSSIGTGLYGEVYALEGAGYVSAGAGGCAGGYEEAGYSSSYASSGAEAFAASLGNAVSAIGAGANSNAGAWNW